MSYEFYKVLHIVGIVSIFLSLGALLWNSFTGGEKKFPGRKVVMITHGVGLLIAFVAGFGLMARIGLVQQSWPGWIYAKVAIWLFLGGIVALIPRKPKLAIPIWFVLIVTAGAAAYLANTKPF